MTSIPRTVDTAFLSMTTQSPPAPDPVRLHTLSELSRIVNLDSRTIKKQLQRRSVYPDAIIGRSSRRVALYELNRVASVLNSIL
jgi:hypothetical protein